MGATTELSVYSFVRLIALFLIKKTREPVPVLKVGIYTKILPFQVTI
jgi:hypothetical protein